MATFDLSTSEEIRDALTTEIIKRIRDLYATVAANIQKEIETLPQHINYSQSTLQAKEKYLNELLQQIYQQQDSITQYLATEIVENMGVSAAGVVFDNSQWMSQVLIPLEGAFSYVPVDAIEALMTGKLYNGNWTLAGALWGDNQRIKEDLLKIVTEGLAQQQSTFEIAKALEMYVDPTAKKPWDWGKVYPGTRRVVDYNAQRLARTLINHAYQYALVACTQKNPFVSGYIWHSAHSDRVCEFCAELDGQFFYKNELPLDHPNGMCFWEAEIPMTMEQIADRIVAWANGAPDSEMDAYAVDAYQRSVVYKQIPKDSILVAKEQNPNL